MSISPNILSDYRVGVFVESEGIFISPEVEYTNQLAYTLHVFKITEDGILSLGAIDNTPANGASGYDSTFKRAVVIGERIYAANAQALSAYTLSGFEKAGQAAMSFDENYTPLFRGYYPYIY